jgi:hypothetical protein
MGQLIDSFWCLQIILVQCIELPNHVDHLVNRFNGFVSRGGPRL